MRTPAGTAAACRIAVAAFRLMEVLGSTGVDGTSYTSGTFGDVTAE